MLKSSRWLPLGLLLGFGSVALAAQEAEPLTLSAALEQAERANPKLSAIRARYQALLAIPPQEGSLPDPEISFSAMSLPVDTFDTGQEDMTQLQFGISQRFPFPGKLSLKQEAAEQEAEAAGDDVKELRLKLRRDVEVRWWRLFYLDRALAIVATNQNLLRQFVEIAKTRYTVGQGLQQDVLLAQLELSRLMDLHLQLEGSRGQEVARLNALLGRPADTPAQLPAEVERTLLEAPAEAALFTRAEKARPLLARIAKQIEAARIRVELARKEFFPDFNLGAFHGFRHGQTPDGKSRPDFLTLSLSMNLPLYFATKQAKAVDQKKSELLRAQFAWQDALNRVRAEISAALSDYRRAREQAVLFDQGIIPQARQMVASMLVGYQVGKVDFLNPVQAQITLYNYEIRYWKTLTEARQARAKLQAAVGERIEESQDEN
ncbi:MAG: TolC family protein [Methylohalobius sp.]|nr:TolC family protein [Methylohalobius sp.]